MGLLTLPLQALFSPVRGVIWLGEVLRDEAERQRHDPQAVRRELEEAEDAAQAGELSADELTEVQARVLGRLTRGPAPGAHQADEGGGDRGAEPGKSPPAARRPGTGPDGG